MLIMGQSNGGFMMDIVIAYTKDWYRNIVLNLKEKHSNVKIHTIESPKDLTIAKLKEINPDYIFFPHWSFYIDEEIYETYNCIIFHMTDLPFGRGGSPLQNLIARGIYETKISAIQCVKELDAGSIYLKRSLSLHGNAEEIYLRAALIIVEMISEIIIKNPVPKRQEGEVFEFERRRPSESNIEKLENLTQVYDYIRMLDAEGYPKAFLETEKFIFEFERASLKADEIHADVRIRLKGEDEK